MSERDPSLNLNQQRTVPAALGELGVAQQENVLVRQNRQIDTEVKVALEEKIEEVSKLELPEPGSYLCNQLDAEVSSFIENQGYDASLTPVGPPKKKNEITKNVDLAFNMAGASKKKGESPLENASRLAAQITENEYIAEASTIGPYVNLELDYGVVAPRVIAEVLDLKEKFGHCRDGEPQLVIIDYSSPNVAKDMTAAHLRSTAIGHSLVKLQRATGNIPFGINHLGDWGAQFGGIIHEYMKELDERGEVFLEEMNANPTQTLMNLYRSFSAKVKEGDTQTVKAANEVLEQLESKDPDLLELWHQFREWTLPAFNPVYQQLGVSFDAMQGESFYEDKMIDVVNDAISKGVLEYNEEGSIVFPSQPLTDPTTGKTSDKIMLKKGDPKDEILLKPNGGTVYLTRDLSAIRYRSEELGAEKILYVIGKEQREHCLKLFAMADQMGYMSLGKAEHISFGHLNDPDGRKMSTRGKKQVPLLKDVLAASIESATSELITRKLERGDGPELTTSEVVRAEQIGVSAVIFNDLKQGRENDILFDPNKINVKEAGNSIYIQYTHARLDRILEKVGEPEPLIRMPAELSDIEKAIILETARFPKIVTEAAQNNAPHTVANYLTSYCQSISTFYADYPVKDANTPEIRNFRLNLTKAAKQVIENAADLLNIQLPEAM